MPELPEVETIARGLSRALGAQAEILEVVVGRTDYVRSARPDAAAALAGRRVRAVTRHGKRLEIECDPPGRVLVHLGMSGQLTVALPGAPREDHTHFVVRLATSAGPREIRLRDPRRFGGVWLDPMGEDRGGVAVTGPDSGARNGARPGGLGPDALEVSRPELRILLRRPRQLKAPILGQSAIAGLGNIYCD
ncbi:MAG: DNA-formamidopyrimidine glycosylase, partial [Gemmatimonadetes bacterium]|nr:DNA-formamidopyrimidine glycosylase [Gemmatimonadota bacterium]